MDRVLFLMGLSLAAACGSGAGGASDGGARGVAGLAADHPTYGPFFMRCTASVGEVFGQCVNWYSAEEPTEEHQQAFVAQQCAPDAATVLTPCPTEGAIGTCTGGASDPAHVDDVYTGYDERLCRANRDGLAPAWHAVLVYYEHGASRDERRESCTLSGGTWSDLYDPASPEGEATFEPADCSGPVPPRNRPEQECMGEEERDLAIRCRYEVRDPDTDEVLDSGDCTGGVSAEFRPPEGRWYLRIASGGGAPLVGEISLEPAADVGAPTRWTFSTDEFEKHRVTSQTLRYKPGPELMPSTDYETYYCSFYWREYQEIPYPSPEHEAEVDVEATSLLCRRGLGDDAREFYLAKGTIRSRCSNHLLFDASRTLDLRLELEAMLETADLGRIE